MFNLLQLLHAIYIGHANIVKCSEEEMEKNMHSLFDNLKEFCHKNKFSMMSKSV